MAKEFVRPALPESSPAAVLNFRQRFQIDLALVILGGYKNPPFSSHSQATAGGAVLSSATESRHCALVYESRPNARSDQPSAVAFDRTPLIAFYRDRPATSVTLEAKAQKPEVGSELDRPGL